jgi:hypothetical protein
MLADWPRGASLDSCRIATRMFSSTPVIRNRMDASNGEDGRPDRGGE